MQKNTFLHSYSDNSDSVDGIFDHASLLPASRMFWKGNFLNHFYKTKGNLSVSLKLLAM